MPRWPAPVIGPERDRSTAIRDRFHGRTTPGPVKAWWHREHPLAHDPRDHPEGDACARLEQHQQADSAVWVSEVLCRWVPPDRLG
ncbi:hypothetical protein [Streptomyces sp. NPDC101455]|uniref:hypothetical protein n=1 Tax=Streptomyces sp. NPDC101455 TaxID=3366142 RepID=UPI0038011310